MSFTDKDILLASVFGSKIAESIPRFDALQNELMKHPIPAIPFFPLKREIKIQQEKDYQNQELWKANASDSSKHFFPLQFRKRIATGENTEPWYTFPYETMISISAGNKIIKRSIAKPKKDFVGTIKEHWSQDDYEITITGILFGAIERGTVDQCYPRSDFKKLEDYCKNPYGIEVRCEPFQLLGIDFICVENWSYPFTKGENVQAYEMKAVSDYTADFLLEIE